MCWEATRAMTQNKKEDDQWVVPHNLYLAVYSPSSVNVLAFDPQHGLDQARNYAAKYPAVNNGRVHHQSGSAAMGAYDIRRICELHQTVDDHWAHFETRAVRSTLLWGLRGGQSAKGGSSQIRSGDTFGQSFHISNLHQFHHPEYTSS